MKPSEVYPLCEEVAEALQPYYADDLRAVMERHALTGDLAFFLNVSLDFHPEPTSAARFQERWPYTAMEAHQTGLAQLAGKDYAEALEDGSYRLTDLGVKVGRELMQTLVSALTGVELLHSPSLARIAAGLRTLVDASLQAQEPANKPGLTYNRHSDPGPEAPLLLQIIQYVADLAAYRDDAHLSTWRPSGVSAIGWEALTLLWRGEADSAHTLALALPYRQHSATDYDRALQDMVQRRWVEVTRGTPDGYTITEIGRSVREHAEQETDRIFYTPWHALSEQDLNALGDLLIRLRDAARDQAPAQG